MVEISAIGRENTTAGFGMVKLNANEPFAVFGALYKLNQTSNRLTSCFIQASYTFII